MYPILQALVVKGEKPFLNLQKSKDRERITKIWK